MIEYVYILGNHIQALGLSRMAARIGLKVCLFTDYSASITRFSNSCSRYILFTTEEDLLEKLTRSHVQKNALIIPTNDRLITFVQKNYTDLSGIYQLSVDKPDKLEICLNKIHTYKKAKEIGIPIPDTHFPENMTELEALAPELSYPVIIKPAIMYTFYSSTGQKVYFSNDADQLKKNYQLFISQFPSEEVIVQKVLSGGAKNLYSFGSFSIDGKVYGGFVANRIRQKPMDFGISTCFAKTVSNQEIADLAIKFLNTIKYSGMAEVEFMYDQDTGEYRLIEINPRSWKWHSIANKLDLNFIEMTVDHINGKKLEPRISDKENIGWIERLTDTFVVIKEVLNGRLGIKEYFQTINLEKEYACWSWKDPLPAIMYVLLSPYLLIKR